MNNPMMNLMSSAIMKQVQNNPMFVQAQRMAQGKSTAEIQQVCRNICKQRGIDLDQAWNQFQSQFPGLR